MPLFCRNILLSLGEIIFYLSSNMQVLGLLSKLLKKIKRFWKLFTERSICERKLIKLKIFDCESNTSFPLSTLEKV